MASKQVARRGVAVRAVGAATRKFGAKLAESLIKTLLPVLQEGEVMPDLELVTVLTARKLDQNYEKLVDANLKSELEAADDAEPRARRTDFEDRTRELLVSTRSTVQDLYGEVGLKAFKLEDPPPSGPALLQYADTVIVALGKRPVLPTPKTRAIVFHPEIVVEELRELDEGFRTGLNDVARERAELAQATVERAAALETNDAEFIQLATFVEALARAAGESELADRIRPSTREPGLLAEQPEDDATDPSATDPTTVTTTTTTTAKAATKAKVTDPGLPGADPFES